MPPGEIEGKTLGDLSEEATHDILFESLYKLTIGDVQRYGAPKLASSIKKALLISSFDESILKTPLSKVPGLKRDMLPLVHSELLPNIPIISLVIEVGFDNVTPRIDSAEWFSRYHYSSVAVGDADPDYDEDEDEDGNLIEEDPDEERNEDRSTYEINQRWEELSIIFDLSFRAHIFIPPAEGEVNNRKIGNTLEQTGLGGAATLFATIKRIVDDLVEQHGGRIKGFTFSGEGGSRQKLYSTLATFLSRGTRFKVFGPDPEQITADLLLRMQDVEELTPEIEEGINYLVGLQQDLSREKIAAATESGSEGSTMFFLLLDPQHPPVTAL